MKVAGEIVFGVVAIAAFQVSKLVGFLALVFFSVLQQVANYETNSTKK